MKKSAVIGWIVFAIIAGVTMGIIIHLYENEEVNDSVIAEIKSANEIKSNESIIETSTEQEKISPNAIIQFETYYNECGDSKIVSNNVLQDEINQNEEYIRNKYRDWKLKKFSNMNIELYMEKNDKCDKHYVIKDNNGLITVYTIKSNNSETLKETTEISTKYLPKEDIELLKKGIRVNGDNELTQKLEDFQ